MILGDFQNEKLHNVAWVADSFNTLVVDSDRLGSQSVQRLQLCPRDSPSIRPRSASVPVRPVSTAGGMSRRLLLLSVLVSLGALNTEAASTLRSRRQAEVCEEATDSFDECTNAWVDNCDLGQHWWTDEDFVRAYDDYKAAFEAGDDGKPDWMARKACNYMTAAVEVCWFSYLVQNSLIKK